MQFTSEGKAGSVTYATVFTCSLGIVSSLYFYSISRHIKGDYFLNIDVFCYGTTYEYVTCNIFNLKEVPVKVKEVMQTLEPAEESDEQNS